MTVLEIILLGYTVNLFLLYWVLHSEPRGYRVSKEDFMIFTPYAFAVVVLYCCGLKVKQLMGRK